MVTLWSSCSAVLFQFLFLTLGKTKLLEFLASWLSPALRKEQAGRPDLLLSCIAESWQTFSCCIYSFILLLSMGYFAFKNKVQLFCCFSRDDNIHGKCKLTKPDIFLRRKMPSGQALIDLQEEPQHHQTTVLLCRSCCVRLGS